MGQIIADLWNGNIAPVMSYDKTNPEIENHARLIEKIGERLEQSLRGKDKEDFEKFASFFNDYVSLTAEQAFSVGFRLGSRIIVEAFTDED